jgi:hypothetical protein
MQIARGRSGPLSLGSPLAFIDRLSLTEVFLNWTVVPLSQAIGLIIPPLSLPSVFTLSMLRFTTSRLASCRIFCGAVS